MTCWAAQANVCMRRLSASRILTDAEGSNQSVTRFLTAKGELFNKNSRFGISPICFVSVSGDNHVEWSVIEKMRSPYSVPTKLAFQKYNLRRPQRDENPWAFSLFLYR